MVHARRVLLACVAAVVALATGLGVVPADAAPKQASLSSVLKALDIAPVPSDYVVIVDTSGSMQSSGLYARTLSSLESMLSALQPSDHLSLITFDSGATVRYRGEVGQSPGDLVGRLPERASGARTDIGAGIEAGIAELERDGANDVGAVLLLTDGKLDAPEDSRFPTATAEGWVDLRKRADAVQKDREVAGYAVALASSTDAALLKRVLPDAVDVPADEVDERLAGVTTDLLAFRARNAIEPDLAQGVDLAWGASLGDLEPGRSVDTTVRVTSGTTVVPLEVSGLSVGEGGPMRVSGFPKAVKLAPGESVEVPVTVEATGEAGAVELAADVASPWDAVIADLGLTYAPSARDVGELRVEKEPVPLDLSWLPWAFGVLGAVAALVLLVLVRRALQPPLVGSVRVTRDGVPVREFLLEGRTQTIPPDAVSRLSGKARGLRRSSDGTAQPGVALEVSVGGARAKGSLFDGDTLTVGDVTLTYTSARTRMIDLISSALP